MKKEEEDTKQQPFYNEWTITKLQNAKKGDTDWNSDGKNWDKHWGMTVGQLISQLSAYPPSQPIFIRRDVGWSGMCNFEIEVGEVVIRADLEDDYDSCREEMKKGEKDTMIVVALMCDGYGTTNLYPDEIEQDYKSNIETQCEECGAVEGGNLDGCDHCNITYWFNGKVYRHDSMNHIGAKSEDTTCAECGMVISEDDIIGDGTNRGLCCVPDYYDAEKVEE